MKPIIILYDKTSLRSCNLLEMVLAGVLQTYENCVFAKRNINTVTIKNHSNKPISCVIHKDATKNVIQRFAFQKTLEINHSDKLFQTIHAPQQIFCFTGKTLLPFDYSLFDTIHIL